MEERISLDELDVVKTGKNTYEVFDLTTGEILHSNDAKLDIAIDIQNKIDSNNKAKKKNIRKFQGKIDLSETHHLNWKKKSHFIKIYRTEMREYKKITRLSANSGLVLFYLQDYTEYGTNKVVKSKGGNFSNLDISHLTGLGIRVIGSSLKELEEKLFIKRIGSSHQREIYINPYLMCPGNEVEKTTAELFDNYKPITPY